MDVRELYAKLQEYNYAETYPSDYDDVYNLVNDYMYDTGDYDYEYLFNDFVDAEYIAEYLKKILKEDDPEDALARIYYFLGDANFMANSLWKIDGYGNVADIAGDDVAYIIREILDDLEDKIKAGVDEDYE